MDTTAAHSELFAMAVVMNCLIGKVNYLIYDIPSNGYHHRGKKNICILVEFSYLNKMYTFIVLREPERTVEIQWSTASGNKYSYARVRCKSPKTFYRMLCHEQR